MGDYAYMDFYLGPAVLLLDGEEFDVMAFIDSARNRDIEDWGGYLETGSYGDVLYFRAEDPESMRLRIPGLNPRSIGVQFIDGDGFSFIGQDACPLPVQAG